MSSSTKEARTYHLGIRFEKIVIPSSDTWSCLCWVGVSFFGFCFLSGSQENVMGVYCLVGILIGMATVGSS